jgi:hypothetical protein
MESTLSPAVDFSVLFELESSPYESTYEASAAGPITNAEAEYYEDDEGKECRKTTALEMSEILTRIFVATDGWPKRIGDSLFVHDYANKEIRWLKSTPALFGWLGQNCGVIPWYRAVGCHSKEETFQQVVAAAESFIAAETLPHEPPIAGHYYACEDLPEATGEHITTLINRFAPATAADRWLLLAMFATAFWGGRGGSRPMFVITSDSGRGAGKTKLSDILSHLVGGCIELSANEDAGIMRQRLLSPGGKNKRIARLDNVKSLKFSWADLESLITVPIISGKEMYVGEGSRPNTLTWLVTLNGPSLSTDIAQRAVIVKLSKPNRNPKWEEETLAFVDQHRLEIIADLIAFLSLPAQQVDCQTRWAAWEGGVLSRLRCHLDTEEPIEISAIQSLIKQRSGESDAEAEEVEILEDFFRARLNELGYSGDSDKIHIPTNVAANWFNLATNERRNVQSASKIIAQFVSEERTRWLAKNPSRKNGRGFLWNPQMEGDADYEIENRIRELEKIKLKEREKVRLESNSEYRKENTYW